MIRFTCPNCQTALTARPEHAGVQVSCGKCQKATTVPNDVFPDRFPFPTASNDKKEVEVNKTGCVFAIGFLFVGLGIFVTLRYWIMDTYLWTSNFEKVHNAGLMNDRLVGAVIGTGWTIAGLLTLIFARRYK